MTLPIGEWIVFQPVEHHDGVGLRHLQGIQLILVETKNSSSVGCNFFTIFGSNLQSIIIQVFFCFK